MSLNNKEIILKQSVKFDILLTKTIYYNKNENNNKNNELNNQIAKKYKNYIDVVKNDTNLKNNNNNLFYSLLNNYTNGMTTYDVLMNSINDYNDENLLKLYQKLLIDNVF